MRLALRLCGLLLALAPPFLAPPAVAETPPRPADTRPPAARPARQATAETLPLPLPPPLPLPLPPPPAPAPPPVAGRPARPSAPAAAVEAMPQALGAAYQFSPELRAARHALNVVNERRPAALAGWGPTIMLSGSGARAQSNQPPDTAYRTGTLGVSSSLSLPITRGGGEYAALRSADHAIRAQRALLLATEQVVLGQAAQAYMGLLLNQALVGFRRENLVLLQRTAGLVERQMEVGDRTVVDLGLAQARVAEAEAQLAQARGAVAVAEAGYRQAMGRAAPGRLALPPALTQLPPSLEEAQSLAAATSPDVVAARFQLAAAGEDAEVALAQLLPSLAFQVTDLRSQQHYRGNPYVPDGRVTGTTVALVLNVPLFQGGAEYAQVRAARKTALQRREELELARLRSQTAVTTAWRQREAAIEAQLGFAASLTANQRLSAHYQRQAEAGELTVLELLNGFTELLNAQINKAGADNDRVLADYAVLNSLGGLTARTLGLAVPYFDPEGDYQRSRWRIWGLSVEE